MSVYAARLDWAVDEGADSSDLLLVTWYKDWNVVDGDDITSPTIRVFKPSDNSDLVATTSLTRIGPTDVFRHHETSSRVLGRAPYMVEMKATIDGSSRTWYELIDR